MQGHDVNTSRSTCADLEKLQERLGAVFQRRPDHARPRLARPRRQPCRRTPCRRERLARRSSRPPRGSACRSRCTASGSQGRGRPDRRPGQGQHARQGHAGHPRDLCHRRRDRGDEGGRRLGQPCADVGAAHRLRLPADRRHLLAAGMPVGLSVDTVELVGNADMFAIMKTIAEHRERQGRERVQAPGAPRARARPPSKARAPWASTTRPAR